MTTISPLKLYRQARILYKQGNPIFLAMQILRPFICPFGELIVAVPEGSRVLDIGCGGGLFLGLLAAEKKIDFGLGIDVSSPAIKVALEMRKNHPRCNALRFEHHDADSLWPESEFDVVSMIDLLHHIAPENRKEFVQRACSHVRPGGILLYKDMVSSPCWRVWINTLHDILLAGQWTKVQNLQEVIQWCENSGFKKERVSGINMLWYGHDIVVLKRIDNNSRSTEKNTSSKLHMNPR